MRCFLNTRLRRWHRVDGQDEGNASIWRNTCLLSYPKLDEGITASFFSAQRIWGTLSPGGKTTKKESGSTALPEDLRSQENLLWRNVSPVSAVSLY